MQRHRLLLLLVATFMATIIVLMSFGVGCAKPSPTPTAPAPKPSPTAPAPAAPAPQVFKLKYSDCFARGSSAFKMCVDVWLKPLEEKSKGRLVFEIFAEGELAAAADHFKLVKEGAVDAVSNSIIWNVGVVPPAGIFWITGLFKNQTEYVNAFWEVQRPFFNKILEKHNQRALCTVAVSGAVMFTNKPVRKMEDLKGLKIRGQGGLPSKFLEALGASAVSMAFPEALTGIQQGTLDGVMWAEFVNIDNKLWKALPYGIDQILSIPQNHIFWNLNSWNKLPPDLQQLIEEHSKQVNQQEGAVNAPARVKGWRDINKASGTTYYTLPDDEYARWVKKGGESWDWFAQQAPENAEILKLTRDYLKR